MLPMDTKPVTRGNDEVLTSKPRHQTSPVPYSTGNRSNTSFFLSSNQFCKIICMINCSV